MFICVSTLFSIKYYGFHNKLEILCLYIYYHSVKEELEEVIIQREVSLANLKKKHSEDISELNNTIENHLKSRQRYVVYQVFHHFGKEISGY